MFHNAFSAYKILMIGMMVCIPSTSDLREGREAIKWIFRMLWRYLLMWNRCRGDQCRCCCDGSRSAATRRHTSGTGAVLRTAHLEKRPLNRVHISNRCRVFQCTVNWARARHKTALIAGGAQRSRGFISVDGERVTKWSPLLF